MADKRRRKSLRNAFKRPETPTFTASVPPNPPSPVGKRAEPSSAPSPSHSEHSSPQLRPRTLQKGNRMSVFGSLRSLHSLDGEEKTHLTRTNSKASSNQDDAVSPGLKVPLGETVLKHAELQLATTTMFRKRYYFIVLTETHLIRFRNQSKAAESFPSLAAQFTRSPIPRSSTMSSIGSFHELQMATHSDHTLAVPLEQIVAVYKLEEGRPCPTVEVPYMNERTSKSSVLHLLFNESRDAEAWSCAVKTAAARVRDLAPKSEGASTLEYIAKVLDSQRDFDPDHFDSFEVVQLSTGKTSQRSSSDDFSKSHTHICYFAIGINKVHFIPVHRNPMKTSTTSLADLETTNSLGIVTLTALKLQQGHDVLSMQFRSPLGQLHQTALASHRVNEIVMRLRSASEYIRPAWIGQHFELDARHLLEDELDPPSVTADDYHCFDRTFVAYCAAYGLDTTRVVYSVDYDCEDSPCFYLLPPSGPAPYTGLELLALLRALRYNEHFTSISFANIDLRPLRDLYVLSDADLDSLSDRSGIPTGLPHATTSSALIREVRALALKSRRLRRLDFTNAIPKSLQGRPRNIDCGIPEALAPLCKRSLTDVDWIILNGIQLGDSDLDYLVDAASERRCHFRALEVGNCGLLVHDVDVLLSTLAIHDNTMEVINISAAQGRFSPEIFQRGVGAFSHIRRLDLTRVQKTAGPEPLIAPEILLVWRLECLYLSQTSLNEQMIEGLSVYLASTKSDTLRELHVNQCGLTGTHLAVLLQSMTRQPGMARSMCVYANDNRLGSDIGPLLKCIAQNYGPISLSMRMIDFDKETHFRRLVEALTNNTTLRFLDISRASLPYDASEETCGKLKEMFAINDTLEDLDISGEHTHLDAARFGIGLNLALEGLQNNKMLKMLRIEHQNLGLQGANTLAGVLESNQTLSEIYCDHNNINLQSFTVLVNALQKNKTLLYLPTLDSDRAKSMGRVKQEFAQADKVADHHIQGSPKSQMLRKGMGVLAHRGAKHLQHRKNNSSTSNASFTEQDLAATIGTLDDQWEAQATRMQSYLRRNIQRAHGLSCKDEEYELADPFHGHEERPGTTETLSKMLTQARLDRTPTLERTTLLDGFDEKLFSTERLPLVFQLPED